MLIFSKKSHYLALLITLIACFWLLSGVIKPKKVPELMAVKNKVLNNVTTQISKIAIYQQNYKIYGNSKAHKIISLKAEISGKVKEIYKNEGAEIAAQEQLLSLEINQYNAQYEEAKANYQSKKTTLEATKKLYQKGLSAKTILANHKADFQAAEAQLKTAELTLAKTDINAPFAGTIERINVETGEIIEAYRSEIAILVNNEKILLDGYIPEKLISTVNDIAKIEVEFINNVKKTGTLNYISTIAEPVTKTYKIEILVDNQDKLIKDGMTAEIIFILKEVKAHKILSSALTLDNDGNIGVKIVNQNNIVEFLPAEIIAEEGEFIWLSNLPDIIEFITIGHGFVQDGEEVLVRRDELN